MRHIGNYDTKAYAIQHIGMRDQEMQNVSIGIRNSRSKAF